MNKAMFLDRDGVINEDLGYVYKHDDFRFIDGIFKFCRTAREMGYLLIVTTNQAGIARGYYTEDDFDRLNEWMLGEFAVQGVQVDKVYYCPYCPDNGIGEYRRESNERKPSPGMLLKARDEFDIDLAQSVLVGDKDSDIEAGRRAGVGKLFVLKGKYEVSCCPPAVAVTGFEQLTSLLQDRD